MKTMILKTVEGTAMCHVWNRIHHEQRIIASHECVLKKATRIAKPTIRSKL